eukprot:CAMPEP_0113631926 /NCGR_PEP_ID=MMETSP0017_2-20120614/16591_1 /TAXON_ID=2856 /ORGANISM="Cylindrotheca closterium" /LENGTH=1166 /DNA_ID=CAMNT_0000542455 /DNA_START=14 /DNA_END=3514 /DNA_ORIENTATION=+ /assembly_acc=CAM_ASM_000147
MLEDGKSIASKSAQTPSDTVSIGNGTTFDHSSAGSSIHPMYEQQSPEVTVTKREDVFISRVKVLVAIVLVVAVSAVATVAFLLVTQQELEGFENQFNGHASEVAAVVSQNIQKLFQALDSTSIMISSEASLQNASWPFVTIDHWPTKAEKLFELGDIGQSLLALAPVVKPDIMNDWDAYVVQKAPAWYQASIDYEGSNETVDDLVIHTIPYIHTYGVDMSRPTPIDPDRPATPIWQSYPLKKGAILPGIDELPTNYDILEGLQGDAQLVSAANTSLRPAVSFPSISMDQNIRRRTAKSTIVQPVFEQLDARDEDAKVVAVLRWQIDWNVVLANVLEAGVTGIHAVIRSSCQTSDLQELSTSVTYRINGPRSILSDDRDVHDPQFDEMEVSAILFDYDADTSQATASECIPRVTLHFYPTIDFRNKFVTQNGLYYAGVVVLIFCFTTIVFLVYDFLVKQRQRIVMDRIQRQDMIVSDVFPSAIRDRLYNQNLEDRGDHKDELLDPRDFGTSNMIGSAPLADLFPNTTVIFADIVGFTAWSSAREPSQVFVLLETIYNAFDKIAYRHGVFKVETVGDCYVAVAGLPEPDEEHAVAACRFARSCLKKMKEITLKLEVSLGPDTSDLDLRTGIHSGQVTAGVLRGERSRFQLFGDTMNTAARMEHTGERNRIQLTEATADLLKEAGLARWIFPRASTIFVKGKGNMQTYWMKNVGSKSKKSKRNQKSEVAPIDETAKTGDTISIGISEYSPDHDSEAHDDDTDIDLAGLGGMSKTDRLVEWHVESLCSMLQQIIASRGGAVQPIDAFKEVEAAVGNGRTVLEEFVPIIELKHSQADDLSNRMDPSKIDIGEAARSQLRKLLATFAFMYKDNQFHNFEHASHVTASVKKLLSRIVKVGEGNGLAGQTPTGDVSLVDLAGHSYGITSDPLTQFAVVFSAIIHDVDHPGVPNAQLVKEKTRNAQIYKNKSVAEQNSVDLAWEIFMQDEYKDLRACIYQTEEDLRRFRQLVVNTVMATDIVDKELQALRKERWDTAFSGTGSALLESDDVSIDRKATIVIEHLIQASDVSHTMQHWHIYKSWNERFFMECYGAFKAGRADVDPSINWYKGEIGFFDFYVIPLAKKLDSCGVFGVSSDEYLNYAKGNREEWVREGENIVKELLAKYEGNNVKNEE